ncbi:YciI family protein [Niabella aurantiaca]|uniref:YciI family protein n=1 Tax=Niabella aurantiaca TaxID=379900 RepID=UPI0003684374|nr:YciI family protein [Niabella aurantiaca]
MLRLLFFLAMLPLAGSAQTGSQDTSYRKSLADSLGADAYGMRAYQFVLLKTGDSLITDKEKLSALFKGHMENIDKLVTANKLIIAGPFAKNPEQYRGLFIFTTQNKEETLALLEADPAIKAGLLKASIYSWYGSAALPMYLPFHKQVQKNKH